MIEIKATPQAFDVMTEQQCRAIARLANNEQLDRIVVQKGGFELPEGYLAFVQFWQEDAHQPIYGGIAPNGDIST